MCIGALVQRRTAHQLQTHLQLSVRRIRMLNLKISVIDQDQSSDFRVKQKYMN